jgi:DNA-binding NarL/FixJ family response regulator
VALVDDHSIVRRGLSAYFAAQPDITVVGEAASGEEALRHAATWQADVIVMDVLMPGGIDGIETTRRLKRLLPQTQIIILSGYADDARVIGALRAGAITYVEKDSQPEQLLEAGARRGAGQSDLRASAHAAHSPGADDEKQRRAHRTRGRSAETAGGGIDQRRNRRAPVSWRRDGQDARRQHPAQTRTGAPHTGGDLRPAAWVGIAGRAAAPFIELFLQKEGGMQHEMLNFVKALFHVDRLRMIGALTTQQGATIQELAQSLNLPFRDVFHHLTFFERLGVVRKQNDLYILNPDGVDSLARRQFDGQPHESYTPAPDLSEQRRKVLKAYLNADGSLKQIPSQPGKLQIILDYVVEAFTPGALYTEKEVNTLMRRFHIDTAALRRYLVDRGMLERKSDGSQYWRTEPEAE